MGQVAGELAVGIRVTLRAGLDHPVEALPRVPTSDKVQVPVPRFCAGPVPVRAVYVLDVHEAPDIRVDPVNPAQRFAIVGGNTYRSEFLGGLGLSRTHFAAAARLARAVHVGRITRPASSFKLDELVDRLEVELGGPACQTEEREASG
ncbi:MAG: hypothetical protein GY778_28445 [bacterium]|nr:hypothetical protein [bacterium]